jgi:flagellar hook-associated protein 1
MQSTFTGIEIGKRSLIAHNQGLATMGHNVSNANREEYSRQRVVLNPTDPLYMPHLNREETPGQIGQGVDIASIERVKDMILEGRIIKRGNGQGYWETADKYWLMVEEVYNEPTELSIRGTMDAFWESWQELSIHPSQRAARHAVVERGKALIDSIHTRYYGLKEIREMLELDVQVTVDRINSMTAKISSFNEQIVKVEAMGDNPNDLLDQRDKLVNELSKIVDITIDNRDPDEYTIHTGGIHIVQGKVHRTLQREVDPLNEGYSQVLWADTGDELLIRGGKLKALLDLRDGDVRDEIQKLDLMTMNFVDMVNDIHRDGYGLDGMRGRDFFVEYPAINNLAGNYDRDGDGEYDSSYVFRITGVNSLNPQEQIGLQGTIRLSGREDQVEIPYFPTDTVEDVIKRINTSGSEVVAQLDRNGKMVLKATPAALKENPDFVIRHIEDSNHFLAGYAGILQEPGEENAYDWGGPDAVLNLRGGGLDYAVAPLSHPSGWVEINRAIENDVNAIAAGFGENGRAALPGDGSAAIALAGLRNSPVMVGRITSFDEYFADVVAEAGLKGENAERALDTETAIMKDLTDLRSAISGVNIDEELAQMIKFQHGYSAAARFITTVNTMLDTIINRMGV